MNGVSFRYDCLLTGSRRTFSIYFGVMFLLTVGVQSEYKNVNFLIDGNGKDILEINKLYSSSTSKVSNFSTVCLYHTASYGCSNVMV